MPKVPRLTLWLCMFIGDENTDVGHPHPYDVWFLYLFCPTRCTPWILDCHLEGSKAHLLHGCPQGVGEDL